MDEVDEFLSQFDSLDVKPQATQPEVDDDVSSFLQEVEASIQPLKPETEEKPVVTETPEGGYSEDDLLKDEFFYPIVDYMNTRFGSHMGEAEDRREVVEKYLNNMRGFAGGNSVRAISEISFLNEIGENEEAMAKTQKAYQIFQNMEGLFGETSFGEKAEIVQDYLRSAILDPTNLIGFGLGKVVTSSGFKAGSMSATVAAKQAYKKKIASGATKETAQKVAERVFSAQRSLAQKSTQQKIQKRAVLERATRNSLSKKLLNSQAAKEIATVGSFEGIVAASTDYLYQDAMLRTKLQEEYNVFQTGLSAVSGIVFMGTLAAGGAALTGVSRLVRPGKGIKTVPKNAKISDLSAEIKKYLDELEANPKAKIPAVGNWMNDVAKGKELLDQDDEFFIRMLLGDDELGLKGLGEILLEQGYVWTPRTPDDKISNWIGDIIKQSDPQDAKKFIKDFSDMTGIELANNKKLTIEEFANTFKGKMSRAMRLGNAASQLARKLGTDPKNISLNDYAEYVLTGVMPKKKSSGVLKEHLVGKAVKQALEKDLPDFQNNLIRLMVANLSTTALNVTGYAAATTLTSASEISRAVLLGGQAGLALVYSPNKAKELGMTSANIFANQVQKLRNTLDPNTTYDRFLEYVALRPKATKELARVLPGGIEDIKKLSEGLDLDRSMLSVRSEQAVDFIQKLHLVQAQDNYTKSIEFVTQLDNMLRKPVKDGGFGMSWNQFFNRSDYSKLMMSDKFIKLEARAVDETLRAVFSKSYKGPGPIGLVARAIEDARNIPGVGLLVPFGRFFNNTVAFVAENTAVYPILSKMIGKEVDRSTGEILTRGAVTASLVSYLALREQDFIDKGLSWSEEIDWETGAVVDEKYEFPYSAYKAAARVVALHWRGEDIPKDLAAQLGDQFFGQLTRQLGEAGEGIEGLFTALLSDEGPQLSVTLGETLGAIGSQVISAGTRFLDPANQAAGLLRRDQYQVPDRKQGNKILNDSFRYIDQFIGIAMGDQELPEKFSAAEGKLRGQQTKVLSTTRETKLTNTERVLNMISRPTYTISMLSDSAKADNRFNEVFYTMVESKAKELLSNKKFREGNLEYRRLAVRSMLTKAKDFTKKYMRRITSNTEDNDLLTMIEISETSESTLKNVLKDLGLEGKNLEDLSSEELDTVQNMIKFREDYLINR